MDISEEFDTIMQFAREEAMRTGHANVLPDHILLGIIRHGYNRACVIMKEAGIVPEDLKMHIDRCLSTGSSIPYGEEGRIRYAPEAERIIGEALLAVSSADELTADSAHLLYAISSLSEGAGPTFLKAAGLSARAIYGKIKSQTGLKTAPQRATITITIKKPEIYS